MSSGGISSPISTGGGGTFFEQHVNAHWLALLLVGGIPPILHDCSVVEVHLQTERLGWHTDDFLIVGRNGAGVRRKLVGQVKRSFTVSATDDECKKAITDFWTDFNDPQQFASDADRFALVTLRGTNVLLEHFSGLLDCARSARDGAEFEHRLATAGLISKQAVRYCTEIQTIVSGVAGPTISRASLWPFLRVLHVLSLDLNSSTQQTETVIKSLLAHTAREQDALGAAEATWNALLSEVGEGMPDARTFRYEDLPEVLRHRHSALGGPEQRIMRALQDHSTLILDGIRSTIGDNLHLERNQLVLQAMEHLEVSQIVLITGTSGSGKSSVAKEVITLLAEDHFAFSFRAEEFAHAHLDQTLQQVQIPASAVTVGALLAGQSRKILLVESVERLLEASARDAFIDLLSLLGRDPSWRLVLTCREYSADLVRASFLQAARIQHAVISVPPLSDDELSAVETVYPLLARPLAHQTLRHPLRIPYFLDKAVQINWAEERSLPESVRDLRELFWRDIVRAAHRAAGGMPQRREHGLTEIALRRARALSLYVPCTDLDAEVVASLQHDSLIVVSPGSNSLVAPAHDVLEDWALLRWVDDQYQLYEGAIQPFSAALGTYPAIRRTYRAWVTELVARDSEVARRLFRDVIQEDELPAHFRDDTLVSLLRSSSSPTFLERHSAALLAQDKQLLHRVIHLLRVACVTMPDWVVKLVDSGSLLNVPDGPAWASILRLVATQLNRFLDRERLLLLGLIEDWARGVSWQTPYPPGADSVATIAYWLLLGFTDYQSDQLQKRTLKVIAKIPNADRERFIALFQESSNANRRNRVPRELRQIIFDGVEGMPVARDMPGLLISLTNEYLLCSESDLRREHGFSSPLEREERFGIRRGTNHDFFPPSAYRGPFLPLLRYNPREGITLIIDIFNHSADWYAHPRVDLGFIEPPFQISLSFADGTSRTQWCNERLWCLYRGTSVGPHALQSLLMALELWLLDYAEEQPRELDALCSDILKRSDSAALTAVVASVATAFPHVCGETLLVLLQSPVCLQLDRRRLIQEASAGQSLLPLPSRYRLYDQERQASHARSHRRKDLETAILTLQIGPLAARVHAVLDQYHAALPAVEEQTEAHRIWRIALARVDLRKYRVAANSSEVANTGLIDEPQEVPPNSRDGYVSIEPTTPEPDIQEMIDQSTAHIRSLGTRLGLMMWGHEAFDRDAAADPGQWWQRLTQARDLTETAMSAETNDLERGGPGLVAAVCIRDHWDEMSAEEQDWCIRTTCAEVEREADHWNQFARMQRNRMSADRPCAWVLPILLGKSLTDAHNSTVHRSFVIALTHAIIEVRWYTAQGIGRHLWSSDRELTLRCINALAVEATLETSLMEEEDRRPYEDRRQPEQIEAEAALAVRQQLSTGAIAADAYQAMDPTTWFGMDANQLCLAILSQAPSEDLSITAFERLGQTFVDWWNVDEDRRERDYEQEATLTQLLEYFLLRTSTAVATRILRPILEAVDRHPREVKSILEGLIVAEDQEHNTLHFWALWDLFAAQIQRASWLRTIDNEHAIGGEMVSIIFLGTSWKEAVRHWQSLEGHAERLHALFETLPTSSAVLDAYVQFLYSIGDQSLPQAFSHIARRIRQGNPRQMMKNSSTVFQLEVLLQRYVYGRPLELKSQPDLRRDVLFLLDELVEQGSSAAFRMRDDFVTPVVIG